MEFDETDRHHREVGHHVVLFQERSKSPKHLRHFSVAALHDFVEGLLRDAIPMPRVLKGFDLRLRLCPSRGPEQDVVIRLPNTDIILNQASMPRPCGVIPNIIPMV